MFRRAGSVLFLFALALAGCGPSGEAAKTDAAPTASGDPFRVALLTPGPISDSGWSAMAYSGLEGIKSKMNAEVANQQAVGAQAKDAMRAYAQKGYKLVFGHGFEYNEPGVELAADFPDTVFVSSSGGKTAKNAGAFRFYLEQGCYLAGMLAALQSKTHKIGTVAVLDIPSINSTLRAFEAGARAADPKVQIVPTVYFGTEGDIAAAKRATESVLDQGADVVIHQANAAAQGVFDACASRKAIALGTNADQNDYPKGPVVASAVIVAAPAFLKLAEEVKAGKYTGVVTLSGMSDGAIDFVIAPEYAKTLPPATLRAIEDAKAKIKSGGLVVPKAEF